MPDLPNLWQKNEVRIARDAQTQQILDRLIGALRGNRSFPHEPPQDLRNLKVEKVRSVEGFAARVDSGLNLSSDGGLKEPVNRRGRVQDDHRASRSSLTRRAVSRGDVIAWRE